MSKRILPLFLAVAACHSEDVNKLPSFVAASSIVTTVYDGNTDDLLTAGLGATGLLSTAGPPGFANAAAPTAAELRRRAIYTNYRALVDVSFAGGFGTLYGPNVDVNGNPTANEGKIAGEEWLAYDDDGTGRVNVTMMVQVPSSFDPNNPCIVTATSSGSRGVYGAIATAGEWGLKHGCAVAYTDKGSGMGVHDLQNNTVNVMDGTRADAADAGTRSNFTANLTQAERDAFNAASPDRFAVKHAHSQLNPEQDWGKYTLHAVEFAYYVLNQKFGTPPSDAGNAQVVRKYHAGQILTIAASVSNGAGASLAAVEQDPLHWISGVVAVEPQMQVASTATIQRGGVTVPAAGKSLYDYMTVAALYQGCAGGSAPYSSATNMNSLTPAQIANRCRVLQADGLLGATTAAAALPDEALTKLHEAGYETDADLLHSTHFSTYATPAVAVTYANAYSRASVKDNLCDYSFAFVDTNSNGNPTAVTGNTLEVNALATVFGYGNGVPPLGQFPPATAPPSPPGANLVIINNKSGAPPGTPKQDQFSQSATASSIPGFTGPDFNVDGMACMRNLFTGKDNAGAPLTGALLAQSNALKSGIRQVQRTGKLRGIPAILIQGRNDALVPVNHASRAYLGANKAVEGASSPVVYYEVTNAQHFDAFITLFQGYQQRFIPLHRYVIQGLDLMLAHLRSGAAIPPSQVVRTTPRCSGNCNPVPPISASNVPPISATPAAGDLITFSNGTLNIPN